MLTSDHRIFRSFAAFMMGGAVLLGGVGCADNMNHTLSTKAKGMESYERGDYVDAASAFQNVIREEPRDYKARYYLGNSYAQSGQFQRAIQAYRTTLDAMNISFAGKRDPEFRAKVVDSLAQSIARSDRRHVELEALAQQAHAEASAELYLVLAKSNRYSGDHDGALERYNQAVLLAPDDAAIHKEYGLYLEQLGKTEQALTPLRRANAVDPSDEEVATALRRHGIVPGPSLKNRDELARPLMPTGPIPDVDWSRIGRRDAQTVDAAPDAPADGAHPLPTATVQSPRD